MAEGYEHIVVLIVGSLGSSEAFIRAVRDKVDVTPQDQLNSTVSIIDSGTMGRIMIPDHPIIVYLLFSTDIRRFPSPDTVFSEDIRRRCGYIITDPYPNWLERDERETRSLINMVRASGLPLVVTTRQDGVNPQSPAQIRESLELPNDIKIVPCSAQTDPDSVRRALLELFALLPQDEIVQHAQTTIRAMIDKG